jgi:hypothetical protein
MKWGITIVPSKLTTKLNWVLGFLAGPSPDCGLQKEPGCSILINKATERWSKM